MDGKKKVVGVEIPDHLHQCIILSSIHLSTTKSQIMRDALVRWVEQNNIEIDNLITQITETRQAMWDRRKLQVPNEDQNVLYKQFVKEQRLVLENLNVNPGVIETILKGIKK